MGTKLPVAQGRLYKNVFVCKHCKAKLRTDSRKVIEKTVRCRKCLHKEFRPVRKK
jgi:ribosomal protein L40E